MIGLYLFLEAKTRTNRNRQGNFLKIKADVWCLISIGQKSSFAIRCLGTPMILIKLHSTSFYVHL